MEIANKTSELFSQTEKILKKCDCDSSCHECLNHFWNQRVQSKLNRYIALQLLGWGEKGVIEKEFNSTEQYEIFKPIKELLELDGEFNVYFRKDAIKVLRNGIEKEIYIYISIYVE
ncbi:DUF1998 domain-containing protein [Clostridium tagluense]|uniref:DUF1998 domain-containing protein n=1 Tax=Clostridium tagluense TaxID=360422 RepID=UPI001C6E14EC|nr:DUF1998 domain-containing protein [Clostridium tagluense]MBW9158736.1 hypothetical protein [Clostridium tagluense]WLC67393.1 hypothetical protein KTC93_09540 [Clostridium tagluense]